jgi:hypothetical protein
MNKKLIKIRMRSDGQWEHVYSDGSVDQEFYQCNGEDLAALYKHERFKKMQEYNSLVDLKEQIIEKALEFSDYEESKVVLQKFLSK